MGTIFGREPALIAGFLSIALNLAITFGLNLSVEQVALINALIVAGLSIIVRGVVTPTASPQLPMGAAVATLQGAGTVTADKK